jgi:WD40 repeat protein
MPAFTARQQRVRSEECPTCHGFGGTSPQSGSTDYPDCGTCGNSHVLEHPYESEPSSHRVAVFRHRATGLELVLVPARLEIAACLVGRTPHAGDVPTGLRTLTAAEARHACLRAGAFDLRWEAGTWKEHPFGLAGVAPNAARLACAVPGLEAEQVAAFHELASALGPIEPGMAPGSFLRTGYGTADPPGSMSAIAFSADGRWPATGAIGDVRVWDAHTGRQHSRLVLATRDKPATLAFSPDGARVATGVSRRGFAAVWSSK